MSDAYNETCDRMVAAGKAWLEQNPGKSTSDPALADAMASAVSDHGGPSGAQMNMCLAYLRGNTGR